MGDAEYPIFGDSDDEDEEDFRSFAEQNSDQSSDESSEDEDEEAADNGERQWTRQARNIPTPIFLKDNSGVLVCPRDRSAKGYFQLLFPDSLFQHIVDQTNLFARQEREKNADNIDKQWWNDDGTSKDTSVEEMKALFGIFIIMGIVKLPSYKCYWKESEPMYYQDCVAGVMPRDRFETLLKYLHLNDNSTMPEEGQPNFNKLYKVQPIIDKLLETFSAAFYPDQEISIDEAMIKYKGRLAFVQKMPRKPIKRGVKVFCLSDAKTGYLLNFEVFTGKEDAAKESLAERHVTGLLKDKYYGANHFLFMDNWFNSVHLTLLLQENKVFTCGMLRKNRKHFPACLKTAQLANRGDSTFAQSGDLVVTLWRDKKSKPVTVISNMYSPEKFDVVERYSEDGKISINRPHCITEYCKYMGGVDLHNQMRSYYQVGTHRSKKWWKYLMMFLLDISIINSYIIFQLSESNRVRLLPFRRALAKQLIGNFCSRVRKGRPRVRHDNIADVTHLPEKMVENGKPKECSYCQRKRKRLKAANQDAPRPRSSRLGCKSCGVYLCIEPCFKLYHSEPVPGEH